MLNPILSSNLPSLVIPLSNTISRNDLSTKPLTTKISTTKSLEIRKQEQNATSKNIRKHVISRHTLKFITVCRKSKNVRRQRVTPKTSPI